MDTIRLAAEDNIVVLARSMTAGAHVAVDSSTYVMAVDLGPGHKLATRPIRRGEKIMKYGAPIGSATRDIAAGEHVHLHNIKSDYLPTYTLESGHTFHKAT